ncbi:MAG: MFS transporter [Eggerthellaceae bacterium]|nr:MFS transporter [Eggerthellaceae bacterium]
MEGKTQEPMTVSGPQTPTASSYITKSDQKTPRYAWVIWIVTYLVSFAAPLGQFKLVSIPTYFIATPVSPAESFMMTGAGFGMLMTCVSLIGIVLAFPAAFICRRIGLKWTVFIATLGVIIGGIIPLLAGENVTALYIGRFIEGLGIGLTGVAAPTIITLWFPEKTRGVMLGLWATWVPLSITLDSIVCPGIAAAAGWRGVFTFVVIFAAVALVLFMLLCKMPDTREADYGVEGSFVDCFKLLKNKNIWLLAVVFFIFIIGQTGIVNTYLPNFLQTSPDATPPGFGWDEQSAGLGLALVTSLGLVFNPLGGHLCAVLPHHLKRIVPMTAAVLFLICFYCMFQTESVPLCWVGIVLMGICGGIGGGGLRPLAPSIMHQSAMAATMSMAVLQFAQCVGNCFSPIYGGLIDSGMTYWNACLVTIIPLSVIMLICGFLIRPGKDSEYQKVRAEQK